MKHLTQEELADLMEGRLAPARFVHVADCDRCRAEVENWTGLLSEIRTVEIPEPSPLFWDHFSDRVRRAIAVEPMERPAWWSSVTGLRVAVGVLLAALVIGVSTRNAWAPGSRSVPTPAPAEAVQSWSLEAPDHAVDDEAEWALVVDVADEAEWNESDDEALMLLPGAGDRAVSQLSDEERTELERLLATELAREKL